MSEEVEGSPESVGPRIVLPCGHSWTLPVGLPPEVAAADLLRHQSACDLDSGTPFYGRWWAPGSWLLGVEAGP